VLLEIVHQLFRHGSGEGLVGGRGSVARIPQHTDLVFHLHHHDGMLVAIEVLDVSHQGPVRPRIRISRDLPERAEQFHALPALDLDAREPFVVLLDPVRSITRQTVLPTAEP